MKAMQDSFAKDMSPLGLQRGVKGSKAEHTTVRQFYQMLNIQVHLANDHTTQFSLSKPPTFNREQWVEQQNQKINQVLRETALKSNFSSMENLLSEKKRKELTQAENRFMAEKEKQKSFQIENDTLKGQIKTISKEKSEKESQVRVQNTIMAAYGKTFRKTDKGTVLDDMTPVETEQYNKWKEKINEQKKDQGKSRGMKM